MPPYALFVQDYYGLKGFGAIYGGIMVLAALGMASGQRPRPIAGSLRPGHRP